MNYDKIYADLIGRAKSRELTGYLENHHIIPRCLGGSDDSSNLVSLTAEEHYIAHQLLVKIYPNDQRLVYAATMMTVGHQGCRNNKRYGWLRRRHSKLCSQKQSGSGNSQFGKIWINDGLISKTILRSDNIPNGWIVGRVRKSLEDRIINPHKSKCEDCGIEITSKSYTPIRFCVKHRLERRRQEGSKINCRISDSQIRNAIQQYDTLNEAALSLGYKNGYSGNVKYRFDRLINNGPVAQK